jgi:DNA repair protein RecO (recombination protein O)
MSKPRTFRSEAIVLKRTDFGEADRLLTLYSQNFGKLKAIAKGARKPQSRKTGHVDLFMRTEFLFAKGQSLPLITQADTVETYAALRTDLMRMTHASYMAELLDQFAVDEDPNRPLYNLLSNGLGWCATGEQLPLATRFYELHLLSLTGFQPQLFRCVGCNDPIQEQDQFFSAELGGVLCPSCYARDRNGRSLSSTALKVLRYLQSRDWETVKGLNLKRPLQIELETIMQHYLTYILEHNLKSVTFLHRLRRENNPF